VFNYLLQGANQQHKMNTAGSVLNVLVGSNMQSLVSASECARALGYDPIILTDRLDGEAKTTAQMITQRALETSTSNSNPTSRVRARALICGGETTVTLPAGAHGLGGRAQEFALAAAMELHTQNKTPYKSTSTNSSESMSTSVSSVIPHTVVLCGGTDGSDGPTSATGAVVDQSTVARVGDRGIDANQYLHSHDSFNFFDALDKHSHTYTTTHTNNNNTNTNPSTRPVDQHPHPNSHIKPGHSHSHTGSDAHIYVMTHALFELHPHDIWIYANGVDVYFINVMSYVYVCMYVCCVYFD
jgi:glycerate-2-kinase